MLCAVGMKQDSDPLLELSGIRADESALPPHSHEALEAVLEPKPMEEEKLPPLDRQPSPAARTSTSSAESGAPSLSLNAKSCFLSSIIVEC